MKGNKIKLIGAISVSILLLVSCKKDDKEAPVLTLNGSNNLSVGVNTVYSELGATATDNEDGAIIPIIRGGAKGLVNTNSVNTYQLIYSATDKSGNNTTIYRYVSVKNLIDYLSGVFNSHKLGYDSLGVLFVDSVYSQTVGSSATINNRIFFTKFASITFAPTSTKINADVDLSATVLTIPSQSALAKVNGVYKTHYYRGNGTVSGDSLIELTYFDSLANRSPERFTVTMTR